MASLSELLDELRSKYETASNTEELFAAVNELFPFKKEVKEVKGTPSKFKAEIECFFQTEEDIENFAKIYCDKSNETIRKLSSKKPGQSSIYQKIFYFRCQHRTRNQNTMNHQELSQKKVGKRFKNTNCPFNISIRLKRKFTESEPTSILNIEYDHNHPVSSLQALTFRDISAATQNYLKGV